MRNVFIVLCAVGVFLYSCEDRLSGFEGSLDVGFLLNGGVESDSVKIGIKVNSGDFPLSISTDNASDIASIQWSVLEGDVSVFKAGQEITEIDVSSSINVDIRFNKAESAIIEFVVTDKVGAQIVQQLELIVFENLRPIAEMDLTKVAQNDPNEVQLSALDSYDRDEKFGGGIAYYEWEVDGFTLTTANPISNYIFSNSGSHIVKLRVVDNDGGSSQQVVDAISL